MAFLGYIGLPRFCLKIAHEWTDFPVSILHKSIAGRYRPVRVADGPITARCRFIKNASCFLFYITEITFFTSCVLSCTHRPFSQGIFGYELYKFVCFRSNLVFHCLQSLMFIDTSKYYTNMFKPKGFLSKKTEFAHAGSKFFPFWVDLFSEGRKIILKELIRKYQPFFVWCTYL